ncbi:Major Facilitator Superfamily protein [Caballeronia temeraria]|uniref:Major Facilitator Superfamily protein n=1 Tax=Caballeronia temeraria TaxID=1777137 RepID=A0A158BUG4_9BURK|nr:Major Facilitator Superfamily protein [Caballeronia temeraria]
MDRVPSILTVIYATFALGVLGGLLVMGNWSDQVGRKRMLRYGLWASTVSALTFLDLSPAQSRGRSTLTATASNMLGLGLGPVLSGALVEYLPWPTRLPYGAHLGLIALAAVLMRSVPETVRAAPRLVLRPQRVALPQSVRRVFIPAALSGFAGFIVIGFFAAVAPQLMRTVLGYRHEPRHTSTRRVSSVQVPMLKR